MQKQKIIYLKYLKEFCEQALMKEGMKEENAQITAQVLSETDAYGIHTHGTKNLHNYIRKMRAGGIDIHANPEILSEGSAYALIDGNSAIGMVPAYKAMKLAIKKARDCGIACAVVRNGSHFGAAGYYANMAAKENMIGLVFSNVDANMTIPGAKDKVMGNNPIAYSVPAGCYSPVFLDIAMSTVASLKVIQARKDGRCIPDTWITDEDGLPTTDPSHYPDVGAMQPMAGHKGYGIALMVEILTGVLSGGGIMKQVPSWLFSMEKKNNVSHMCIVIDISKFMDPDLFNKRMESVVKYLHCTPKAKGTERIYYPGEMEWERYEEAMNKGIVLPKDVEEALIGLQEESGIPINWQ
ncbi:MAG: Ldh family oxidoreductase [Clostridia bacterium]|nr:Ldh family oxidoreductase [Clostridia bacterium]